MRAPIETCVECATNFEVRKTWDNVLYDFKVFEQAKDYSYIRMSYSIHAPFPVTDRDFYLEQLIRRDYPSKGQITMHVRSLPDCKEYPPLPNKVRGSFIVMGMILTPRDDSTT